MIPKFKAWRSLLEEHMKSMFEMSLPYSKIQAFKNKDLLSDRFGFLAGLLMNPDSPLLKFEPKVRNFGKKKPFETEGEWKLWISKLSISDLVYEVSFKYIHLSNHL
jgi:hypothetical protein